MRVWLLFSLLAGAVSCGDDLGDMCEYDCHETRACLVELGYLPEVPEATCVDNCLAATEDPAFEARFVDLYDTCEGLTSCDWVECAIPQGPRLLASLGIGGSGAQTFPIHPRSIKCIPRSTRGPTPMGIVGALVRGPLCANLCSTSARPTMEIYGRLFVSVLVSGFLTRMRLRA